MDYINTSHPNFIGGSRALEVAQQQIRSLVVVPVTRQRDSVENDMTQASERGSRPRGIVGRATANGFIRQPANGVIVDQGARPNTHAETERSRPAASSMWGISALFSGSENQSSAREAPRGNAHREPAYNIEHASSIIHLREPPTILRSPETPSEQEATEIAATKLLLSSYFDIVRKIIEDSVPKAVMHFLVNHTKRELHNVLIQKLYRENLFEEMLQEPGEVAVKRKRARETLRVLQQAFQTLDELPLEAEAIERGYSKGTDVIGLPRAHGLPLTSSYASKFTT